MKNKIILILSFAIAINSMSRALNFKRIADFKVETKHTTQIPFKNDKFKLNNEMNIIGNVEIMKDTLTIGGVLRLNDNFLQKNPVLKNIEAYFKYNLPEIDKNLKIFVKNSLGYSNLNLNLNKINYKINSEIDLKYKKDNFKYTVNSKLAIYNFKKFRGDLFTSIEGKKEKIEFIKLNSKIGYGYYKNSGLLFDIETQAGTRPTKETRLVFNNRLRVVGVEEKGVQHKKAGLHILSGDLKKQGEISNNFNVSLNYSKNYLNIKTITILEYMKNNKNKLGYGQKTAISYKGIPYLNINGEIMLAGINEFGNKKNLYGKFLVNLSSRYTHKINRELTIIPKVRADLILPDFKISDKKTKHIVRLTPEIEAVYRVHPLFRIKGILKSSLEYSSWKRKDLRFISKPELKLSVEYIWR